MTFLIANLTSFARLFSTSFFLFAYGWTSSSRFSSSFQSSSNIDQLSNDLDETRVSEFENAFESNCNNGPFCLFKPNWMELFTLSGTVLKNYDDPRLQRFLFFSIRKSLIFIKISNTSVSIAFCVTNNQHQVRHSEVVTTTKSHSLSNKKYLPQRKNFDKAERVKKAEEVNRRHFRHLLIDCCCC